MKKRIEYDSLGSVEVPENCFWGAQTERSLMHFSIGNDLIPKEIIDSYLIIKEACAKANYDLKKMDKKKYLLIKKIVKEIQNGEFDSNFPLHVWMTGSGTQFNMNMNEVIANIASKISRLPLGSKKPLHPNDDVNMSQSSNDTFPTAMHIAVYKKTILFLLPALENLINELENKAKEWKDIVKIGRTHMQDAVPLTLGQEFSGYGYNIKKNLNRINFALKDLLELPLGGTAVGTGLNSPKGFDKYAILNIAKITGFKFISVSNKFALLGSHDALVAFMSQLKILSISLFKIANDIRILSCGPRAGFFELKIPQNEPGSSIMPGKVNPTQCEAMAMVCAQIMGLDVANTIGGSAGYLEMNVYKPMLVFNILNAIQLLSDSITNFVKFLLVGTQPNKEKINEYLNNSLMLVTALSPVIGYEKASKMAHYAYDHNCSLEQANKVLKILSEQDFKKYCNPANMI